MVNIHTNVSLIPYQTFGVKATAAQLAEYDSAKALTELLAKINTRIQWLGGGSNVLFLDDYDGAVLVNRMKGVKVLDENEQYALVDCAAGEDWHSFVIETLKMDLGGLENLSLIPGTVGASPIQNIGAYGVELKDVFHSLLAYDLKNGELREFNKGDCKFGYRNSIFKQEYKGRYIITNVRFKLSKTPGVNIEYGAIQSELQKMGVNDPTIHDVSQAVIAIRSSKLPDPSEYGNAGSFFKNPIVESGTALTLKDEHPDMPIYAVSETHSKLAAGWLIEKCGWKGKRIGNVGCHTHQSLVIVNYGGATGHEVWQHAQRVAYSVVDTFGIDLEPEVTAVI